jgi:hypothetical protein
VTLVSTPPPYAKSLLDTAAMKRREDKFYQQIEAEKNNELLDTKQDDNEKYTYVFSPIQPNIEIEQQEIQEKKEKEDQKIESLMHHIELEHTFRNTDSAMKNLEQVITKLDQFEKQATMPENTVHVKLALETILQNGELGKDLPKRLARKARLLQKTLRNISIFATQSSSNETETLSFVLQINKILTSRIEAYHCVQNVTDEALQEESSLIEKTKIFDNIDMQSLPILKKDLFIAKRKELENLLDIVGTRIFNILVHKLDFYEIDQILQAITPNNTQAIIHIISFLIEIDDRIERYETIFHMGTILALVDTNVDVKDLLQAIKIKELFEKIQKNKTAIINLVKFYPKSFVLMLDFYREHLSLLDVIYNEKFLNRHNIRSEDVVALYQQCLNTYGFSVFPTKIVT